MVYLHLTSRQLQCRRCHIIDIQSEWAWNLLLIITMQFGVVYLKTDGERERDWNFWAMLGSPAKASFILYLSLMCPAISTQSPSLIGVNNLRLNKYVQMASIMEWQKKSERGKKKGKRGKLRLWCWCVFYFFCVQNHFWFACVWHVCYARIPPLSVRFDFDQSHFVNVSAQFINVTWLC